MNDIEVSSIDLVEGGNVFKQGHYLTLGYVPRDEKGETVDLSGKTLNVSLWGRKGVVFEAAATYSGGVIRFTFDKLVAAGDYTVEFTATSSTDAKYRKKFPTNQHSGRIAIKQSADDLGVVGIQVYTVAQLKAEQKALLDAAVSGFTVDSETQMARVSDDKTYTSLRARLEGDKQATAQQLADKATKKELQSIASGSPKGAFSTVANLQSAYPNGAEGIFVVDDTGEWYYWKDSAWISGGVYQASMSSVFPATNEVTNGNFANGTANWLARATEATIAVENGKLRMNVIAGSANFGSIINVFPVIANDKYYVKLNLESNVSTDIQASTGTGLADNKVIGAIQSNVPTSVSNVVSWGTASDRMSFGVKPSVTGNSLLFSEVLVINLTKTFGNGLEPTKEEMDNLINTFHNGWFNGTVRPFISQKELYALIKKQVPAEGDQKVDGLAKALYEDQHGMKYSFNGNLNQVMSDLPIGFSRDSVSYDAKGVEVPTSKAVFEDFKLLSKKGLRIAPDTTNVFGENNSISFTSAETRSLGAGTYNVSIKGGTGKLVLSGGVTAEVLAGKTYSFTLVATESVTFTPVNGVPAYSQLEKQIMPTPWQKGGKLRVGDSPRIVIPATAINEYGIGMLMRFPLDSSVVYPANEYWLLYGHQDADNYFRLIYSTLQQRFSFYQVVGGVVKLVQGKQTSFKPNDLMAMYIHVIPGEGMFLYTKKGVTSSVVMLSDKSLQPFNQGLKHISIGHRLREESQRAFFANVTIADLKIDLNRKPNAEQYFKEVL